MMKNSAIKIVAISAAAIAILGCLLVMRQCGRTRNSALRSGPFGEYERDANTALLDVMNRASLPRLEIRHASDAGIDEVQAYVRHGDIYIYDKWMHHLSIPNEAIIAFTAPIFEDNSIVFAIDQQGVILGFMLDDIRSRAVRFESESTGSGSHVDPGD